MGDFTTEWEMPELDSVPSLAENMAYLLPGCDSVLMRKTLQATYRDFCKRGAALRTWRNVHFERGRVRYPIAPILSGEIDCVTQVVWMHSRLPVWGWRVVGDAPPMLEFHVRHMHGCADGAEPDVAYVQEHENVGSVPVEVPNGNEGVKHRFPSVMVEAVEVPHIGEERAPKPFLQRYGDALVDGALARLFLMQGKAWTDVEQGRQRGIAYANALSEVRQRGLYGGPSANTGGGVALDMRSMV